MSSVTPLVVTHPCALFRDGLSKILSKSPFRPVHILHSMKRWKAIWPRRDPETPLEARKAQIATHRAATQLGMRSIVNYDLSTYDEMKPIHDTTH